MMIMFGLYLSHCVRLLEICCCSFYNDEHVRTVFIPLREAIRDLLLQFSQYVSGNV